MFLLSASAAVLVFYILFVHVATLLSTDENNRTNPLELGTAGGVVAPPTPSKVSLDLEHLRGRCKLLQEELDRLRRTLSTEREENQLKMSKMEASLNAAKKANMELEVCVCAQCAVHVCLCCGLF